jgi:arsenate reductase
MTASLPRRAVAEFLGTGLLVTVVVGSGIAAQRLSADPGLRLFENAAVTAVALPVLILMFGPVSGGHFNPVVSLVDWTLGRRSGTGVTSRDLGVYLPVQVAGAISGALLANAMFGQAAGFSTHDRSGGRLWLGEVVATAGLILVIVALARGGDRRQIPWAVGAYIGAAYWFTSSTAFANPAVSVGRMFSNSFAGIAPASVPGFVVAELIGGAVGLAVVATLYSHVSTVASEVVVPREELEPAG